MTILIGTWAGLRDRHTNNPVLLRTQYGLLFDLRRKKFHFFHSVPNGDSIIFSDGESEHDLPDFLSGVLDTACEARAFFASIVAEVAGCLKAVRDPHPSFGYDCYEFK